MQYSNSCITVYIYINSASIQSITDWGHSKVNSSAWSAIHKQSFGITILDVESLARHVGTKNTEVLGAHRCNWSQNLVNMDSQITHYSMCVSSIRLQCNWIQVCLFLAQNKNKMFVLLHKTTANRAQSHHFFHSF